MDNRRKAWLSVALALLFVASVLFVPHAGSISVTGGSNQSSGLSALRSSPLSQVAGAASAPTSTTMLGQYSLLSEPAQYNGNAQITVTIGFKSQPGLSSFVQTINNPSSTDYRHFATSQQLGALFGLAPAAYGTIASYFESYGLTVQPSNTYLSMQVTGSVSDISQALHTTVSAYSMQYASNGVWNALFGNGSGISGSVSTSPVFYVNTGGIYLPSAISQYVNGVVGLGGAMATPNIAMPYGFTPQGVDSNLMSNASAPGDGSVNVSDQLGSSLNPYSLDQIQSINNANYTFFPSSYIAFGQTGMWQVLFPSTMHVLTGANNLWSGQNAIDSQPDTGQGITVAVIEVGSLPMSILQGFSQEVFGNPNQVTGRLSVISPFGESQSQMVNDGFAWGWSLETALDIEYIAALAPSAHIDLIGIPAPYFSMFDYAYAYTAQYLSTGASPATSVSITSNSYGSGEEYTAFFGSPMYLTVEDQLLELMNAVGITNFFASGDYSGAASGAANQAGMPAISPGSTSVGGGQLTALSNGEAFPNTNIWALYCEYSFFGFCFFGIPMQVAQATGQGSFTYWSYGFGLGGTLQGTVGGGFGQSISEQQPWWQNALDSYSSGAAIDPVISGPAAFNMSVYYPSGFGGPNWQLFYGGTSFATPISAGEWALIEEQANVAFGTPKMGDINPVLYAAHNAYEAGVSSFGAAPFTVMQNTGVGYDSAPTNNYNWYYFNLSINEPSDPLLPWWYNTLYNPAGSGWNYLQGVGMISLVALDNELIGQVPGTQHALLNEPFIASLNTSGMLGSFDMLQAGTSYSFQVVLANGQMGGSYNVIAYSGNPNDGTYGGGMATMLQTSADGQFMYTPQWSSATPGGSSYGYFLITSAGSSDWAFQPFAVTQPPMSSGILTLGVVDPSGLFQTNTAEVTTFTTTATGFYNLWGQSEVLLNGTPAGNAIVTETAVNLSVYQQVDPSLPVSSYAPGVVIGNFISDQRGEAVFWTDAFTAELNGALPTQLVTLQAHMGNLVSNSVTVYIEPQSGNFAANVGLNAAGTALVGNVTFSDMKYVNFVNISIGGMPGQYTNISFAPAYYDSTANLWESGVYNGIIPIDFTNLPPAGTPIQLNMVAQGANDLSFVETFFGFTFVSQAVQNPMTWSDPITVANPGPAPTASLTTSAPATASGVIGLNYAGSWSAGSVNGALTISSGQGTTTLASGPSSGTYQLNTSLYLDGFYTVTYTATTSTGLSASASQTFYFDNTQASLDVLVSQLQSELNAAQATISSLQSQLSADSASISSLQSQLSSLNVQLSSLQSALGNEMALYNTTAAQLASVQATAASQKAVIASLQAKLASENSTIASQHTQISSLQSQVVTLQQQLDSKKGMVPAAWYDIFGGAGIVLLVLIGLLCALAGVIIGGRATVFRRKQKSEVPKRTPDDTRQ